MGIIAIMLLIGVGTLIATRTQFAVDGIAEEMLSAIREAQNKSISVMEDSNPTSGYTTKVWSVRLRQNGSVYEYVLLGFDAYNNGSSLSGYVENNSLKQLPNGATLTVSYPGAPGNTLNGNQGVLGWISYSSPFGKAYLTKDSLTGTGTGGCAWKGPNPPFRDYAPDPTNCSSYYASATHNQETVMKITINYQTQSKVINVQANGDAYIE